MFTDKMEAGDGRRMGQASGTCELVGRCARISSIAPKSGTQESRAVVDDDCHWEGAQT
jgi:hypothetical protein